MENRIFDNGNKVHKNGIFPNQDQPRPQPRLRGARPRGPSRESPEILIFMKKLNTLLYL